MPMIQKDCTAGWSLTGGLSTARWWVWQSREAALFRRVDCDSVKDLWNYGEPYDSYPIDTARLRRVVELVADKGGWGRSVPKDHGLGIAVHRSFVSYIATIVEVAVDDKGKLSVPRVDTAIDCGTFVNPERIQSQIEGAAIMGLSLAKYGEDHLQGRQGATAQL
jgi:isoquinoline 1-oxidoreductase subunit beta